MRQDELARALIGDVDTSAFGGEADSPLNQAVELWRLLAGQAGTDVATLTRVDVDTKTGVLALTLTTHGSRGARWWRYTGNGLVALDPASDPALPMARTLVRPSILSYRPGRRLVVSHAAEAVVEKGYRTARFQAAAQRHQLVVELAGNIPGLVLPRVREHRIGTASLLLERVAGKPLLIGVESAPRYAAFGRVLRVFQETTSSALPERVALDELRVLELWHERVALATGESDVRLSQAFALARQVAETLPETEAVLAHCDLHDGQLLDQGDALALLDFDQLACADPALDPGNLSAHLHLRALQRFPGADAATATAAVLALRAGLGRDAEPGFARRLAFYHGACLLRLALVYRLRSRWYTLAPTLLEEGMRCLERPG